jgi:ribosomal protein L11 methyltransferase
MYFITGLGPLRSVKAGADALDFLDPSPATAVSWFEEGEGRFRLEAYADDRDEAMGVLGVLDSAAPELNARAEPVKDADWVAMALDGLPAVKAGRFVVAGAHALAATPKGATRIWIEASEAFGTGHHGTTMGCLLALEDRLRRGKPPNRVLDVGAGSGVLAIAAAKAGAASALAVEIDARAAEIARENVANNRVGRRVAVRTGDGLLCAAAGPRRYDLVFANILFRPLIRMAAGLARAVAPGGAIVLSGLLVEQAPLVRLAYEGHGLVLVRRTRREGWATLVLERPKKRPPPRPRRRRKLTPEETIQLLA